MAEITDAELSPVIGMDVTEVWKWVAASRLLGESDPREKLMTSPPHRQQVVELLRAAYLSQTKGVPDEEDYEA